MMHGFSGNVQSKQTAHLMLPLNGSVRNLHVRAIHTIHTHMYIPVTKMIRPRIEKVPHPDRTHHYYIRSCLIKPTQLASQVPLRLKPNDVDGGVEVGESAGGAGAIQTVHLSAEDVVTIRSALRERDGEGDVREDVRLRGAEIEAAGDSAEGSWDSRRVDNTDGNGNVCDALDVVGSRQDDLELLVGIDGVGCNDSGDDGRGGGGEGGQESGAGSCETHFEVGEGVDGVLGW